jgi:hypothetical protein
MMRWEQTWVLVGLLELSGCSGTSSNSQGTGGNNSVGGTSQGGAGTGGAAAGGETHSTGGASSNMNTATSSSATGGSNSLGGSSSSSGGNSTVSSAAGGSKPTGGSPGTGGTAAAGGSKATGGTAAAGTSNTGGSKAGGGTTAGGTTSTGGSKATGGTVATGGSGTGGSPGTHVSVLQHHNHASRDGVYVDAAITKASAANLHIDASFASAALSGPTYAQPLYLASSGSGPDLVIAATEQNRVYAFNAATGAQVYNVLLSHTLPRSQLTSLSSFCGNIDPLGITGTPIIDGTSRTIYLDTMTSSDGTAANARHQVYALNADTGATLTGWPVDLTAKVPTTGGTSFNSLVQNQRGALALLGGKVFVPFGGHIGDCADYHGWVVGISTSDPTQVSAWATRAIAGGIWAPGGIASDGTSLFFATGNTEANPNNFAPPGSWQDGEAIFRLAPSLATVSQNADYYAPTNWPTMDQGDDDLGGSNPLVVDVAGATPSNLIIALGKDGKAYALNRANLGGISAGTSVATVSTSQIINAPAAYTTSSGSYVVFKGTGSGCPSGQSGGLTAIKIGATSPPSITVAWCGGPSTNDSPAVSMSNAQGQDAIVWIVGSDNKLHGLDGNTGASVYAGGTGTDTMSSVQKFETPIVANGRVFVAANNQVYGFTP